MSDAAQHLTSKEFLEELADLRADMRREIEAHQAGLDPSKKAVAMRRERVLYGNDFQFFAYTYFPHHIRGTPSIFQAHFCQRFPQILRLAGGAKEWWVAPRGEAKSSLLTKIGPVWCAVQALLQRKEIRDSVGWSGLPPYFIDYIVLLGAETRLPTKLMEVSKIELTVNASLQLDFPEACGASKTWKVGEFITRAGMKVEPFGAEQAIRGTFHGASRPKWLAGDDLITDAEAKSPTERENRWNWLEKSIDYLGPPDGSVKYLGVGTVLNKDDPISRARRTIGHIVHHFKAIEKMPDAIELWADCETRMRNDDPAIAKEAAAEGRVVTDADLPSFQFYQAHQEEMEKGAVTSWPSVRSLYWLMRQRAKSIRAFGTEMQGDPRDDEDRVFTNIRFWVSRLSHWMMMGGCDPSMGKNEKSDPSAILVGAYERISGKLHVEHAEIKRRLPSKLKTDLVAAQQEYKCIAWGFENNNAYEYMRQEFIAYAISKGVALPLIGITTTTDPFVRIDAMEPFINDAFEPRILFRADLASLLSELDTWPEAQTHHHYDGMSALEILWTLCVKRGVTMEYTSGGGKRSRDAQREESGSDQSGGYGGRGAF